MKAIHWTQIGKPEDILTWDPETTVPTLNGSNVLIKVHAVALNPVDWKLMKGGFPRFLMPNIKTPGLDVSGVVVGLGPNCGKNNNNKFAIGDRVMAMLNFAKSGALQEYTTVDESLLAKTPQEWDDTTAAAFPLVGSTVYEALIIHGKIKAGDKVLINGASGGTGTVAVQVASALGASVTGVCSKTNVEFVKKLGAVDVVDYASTKVHEKYTNQEFDIVLDTVGSDELCAHRGTLLKSSGMLIQIAGSDRALESPLYLIYSGIQLLSRKLYGVLTRGPGYHLFTNFPNGERLATCAHILVRANAKPQIDRVYAFSLEQVVEAYKMSQSGRAKGKLVISIV